MVDTNGSRIVYCRKILGLTRHEFATKIGISTPTIARWELDYTIPQRKKFNFLVDFFAKNDLIVDIEWLINGSGFLPINKNLHKLLEHNFDEVVEFSLTQLKSHIPDLQIKQIMNTFFSPVINYGDYVGVEAVTNLNELDNNLIYIESKNEIVIGILSLSNSMLRSVSSNLIELDITQNELIEYGRVLWIAKRK